MIRRFTYQETRKIRKNIISLRQRLFPGCNGWRLCAHAFGVEPRVWCEWEKGAELGPEVVLRIAEFFGIDPEALLGDTVHLPYIVTETPHTSLDVSDTMSCEAVIMVLDRRGHNTITRVQHQAGLPPEIIDEITRLSLVVRGTASTLSCIGYCVKIELLRQK